VLDKVINKHIDNLLKIEADIDADIDKIMAEINIGAIINNPQQELNDIIGMIKKRIIDEHIPLAIEEGIGFAKNAEKDGEIEVSKSKNPTANENLLDDKSRD